MMAQFAGTSIGRMSCLSRVIMGGRGGGRVSDLHVHHIVVLPCKKINILFVQPSPRVVARGLCLFRCGGQVRGQSW